MDFLRILSFFFLVLHGRGEMTTTEIATTNGNFEDPSTNTSELLEINSTEFWTVSTVQGTTFPPTQATADDDITTSDSSIIDTDEDIIYTEPKVNSTELPTMEDTEGSTSYDNENGGETTTSTHIETNFTICASSPCRNGATCTEIAGNPSLFNCSCPPRYEGPRCGTLNRCELDENGSMCTNGACVTSTDDSVRTCVCFREMHWDSKLKRCREIDLPCFPDPCLNGGSCLAVDDNFRCDCPYGFEGEDCSVENQCGQCKGGTCVLDEERPIKYCRCPDGMFWNRNTEACEDISLPCQPNPCENGGICVPVTETEFNCTCDVGFSGSSCEIVNECSSDENCGGHGECVIDEEDKTRACRCEDGYFLEEPSHTCQKIEKPCHPNPCLHDGICDVLTEITFNCSCADGYTGKTCSVRNACELDGGNAFCAGAHCTDVRELDVYFCICEDGQYFDYSRRKCVDLNLCPLMRCGVAEVCSDGKCECQKHYKRDNSSGNCKTNFCESNPCPDPDMECEEGAGKDDHSRCHCKIGYAFDGTRCIEARCIFPTLNDCDQMCSATEEGYDCACAESFQLDTDNRTCTYIGNATCSNKTCEKGTCVAEDSKGETCICPNGHIEVNGSCVDACSAGVVPEGICPTGECDTLPDGRFRCRCEGKYALSKDKTTCTIRNVCQKDEVGWRKCNAKNARCVPNWDLESGFECICAVPGHVESPDGVCRDICAIERNQQFCFLKGATCDVDVDGKMACTCQPYFRFDSPDGVCNRPAEYSYLVTLPLTLSAYSATHPQERSLTPSLDYRKIKNDITLMARTHFAGFSQANVLACSSRSDFILCEVELQFQSSQGSDLRRLKIEDACLEAEGSGSCLLPPSLVLMKAQIAKEVEVRWTDPCNDYIREEICGSETTCASSTDNFNCSCKPGFDVRGKRYYPFGSIQYSVEICKDINECLEKNPCPENSECTNTLGSYACSCKPGFRSVRGDNEEECVDVCNPNPCTHGKCGRRGDHAFDCTCDAGYRGTFCNLQDHNYKSARINTVIVGVVLGGVLLITLILFAVCMSRLRKKKSMKDSDHMLYNSAEMTERRRIGGGAINNAFQRE